MSKQYRRFSISIPSRCRRLSRWLVARYGGKAIKLGNVVHIYVIGETENED